MGVGLVWKHETGIEGDQLLPSLGENCETLCPFWLPLMLSHEDIIPQFSWQQLAAFGSRFDFPDWLNRWLNVLDHLKRPKTVSRTNLR